MTDDDDRSEWFAAKRYGYGSGWPISWQGWVVMLAYIAVVMGASIAFRTRPLAVFAILIPATVAMSVICAKTTRGGWRWRWGKDED